MSYYLLCYQVREKDVGESTRSLMASSGLELSHSLLICAVVCLHCGHKCIAMSRIF